MVDGMPWVFYLFASYGLAFGIQNKATFLRKRNRVLDYLLNCTYCLGFHTGWVMGLAYCWAEGVELDLRTVASTVFFWGFASSAFVYWVDAAARWCEYRPR